MKKPWEFDAELDETRLEIIAKSMIEIINSTHDVLSSKLDNPYTRGTGTFGRIQQHLCNLAIEKPYKWFDVINPRSDITFTIGGIPCRFFSGNPSRPKAKIFRRNPQDRLFPKNNEEVCMWRFIIEKATQEYDEHKVHCIGYNELQEQISEWTYESNESNLSANQINKDVKIPNITNIDMPEAEVSVKKDVVKKSE